MEEFLESSVVPPLGKYHSTTTLASSASDWRRSGAPCIRNLAAENGRPMIAPIQPRGKPLDVKPPPLCGIIQSLHALGDGFAEPLQLGPVVDGATPHGKSVELQAAPQMHAWSAALTSYSDATTKNH